MMKKLSNTSVIIGCLIIALVTMSVGFAAYASNLTINGTTNVEGSTWSISFDEASYQETVGSVVASNKTVDATSMTYEVSLQKPGDFYEFTINVNNKGTFDAQLSGITMSTLTAEQAKYLTYTITYDGNSYTTSQTNLNLDLLKSGSKSVKVRVEYIQPELSTDLPAVQQTISLNATLNYVQKP